MVDFYKVVGRSGCALLVVFAAAACAKAQDGAGYIALVEEAEGKFHASVDKELFTNRGVRNSRQFLVRKICRGDEPLNENKKEFDAWFKGYYYPLMTDPQQLPELAKLRRDLMRDYFPPTMKNEPANLQVRDYLNKLTLEYLRKFVSNNLHPAVRYNAMLIIGDLNSRAAEPFGVPKPEEPMFEAFEVLQTELTSPTQIDAVRVAALLGLKRHAEINRQRSPEKQWTEAQVTALAAKLGAIATAKKPPAGRSVDGHVWMRRLSLEVLSDLAAARPLPAVATLVDRIVSDPDEPLDLRVAAAKAQGKLKSPLPMGEKPGDAAKKIGRVGVDVIALELDELKHYLDKLDRDAVNNPPIPEFGTSGPGRLGRDSGFGILGPTGDTEKTERKEEPKVIRDPRLAAVQRRLKSRLESLRQGLVGESGTAGLAALGDKAEIDKLASAISVVQQTVDKAPPGDPIDAENLRQFHERLAENGAALEELLPAAKPATEAAAPAATAPAGEAPASGGPVGGGPAIDAPVADPLAPAP